MRICVAGDLGAGLVDRQRRHIATRWGRDSDVKQGVSLSGSGMNVGLIYIRIALFKKWLHGS